MRRLKAFAVPLVVLFVAAACGGESAPEQGGFGVYEYEVDGATITIEIPASDSHSLVTATESFRRDAGAPPATYAVVTINNSDGDSNVSVFQFSVVTDEGQTFEFSSASELVGDWRPSLTSDSDLANRGIRLSNEMLNLDRALPGAISTALFATEGSVPSLKTLVVQRNLLDFLGSIEDGATPEPIRPRKIRSQSAPDPTEAPQSTATTAASGPDPTATVRPTATSLPTPTVPPVQGPTSRELLDENIQFVMERFDKEFADALAGQFSDELHFEFTVGNDLGRDIRALTGDVVFSDLFEREFERLGVTINDPIPAGARLRFSNFFFEINEFIDSEARLFGSDLEDLIVTFEVESVILEDGTRIDATDDRDFATPVPLPTPTATLTPTATSTRAPRPTATPGTLFLPTAEPLVPVQRAVDIEVPSSPPGLVFPGWERLLTFTPEDLGWSADLPQTGSWTFHEREISGGVEHQHSQFTTSSLTFPGVLIQVSTTSPQEELSGDCNALLRELGRLSGVDVTRIFTDVVMGTRSVVAEFNTEGVTSDLSDQHTACVWEDGTRHLISMWVWPPQAVDDGLTMLRSFRPSDQPVADATPAPTASPTSQPTPTPVPVSDATFLLTNPICNIETFRDAASSSGQVTNISDTSFQQVFVVVRWLDAEGVVVKSSQSQLQDFPFPPNAAASFSLNTAGVADITGCRVEFTDLAGDIIPTAIEFGS